MGITKNRQSDEVIARMAQKAFPKKQMEACKELTEGMCNAAYLVTFTDGSKSIVKIASGDGKGLMSNEVNMMQAEVKAMRIVRKHNAVKVAEVYYYDTSHTICDGNYFFMEVLEGKSCSSLGDTLTEEEKSRINYEAGQIERNITSICGEKFGFLGEKKRYEKLFDFFHQMISNVLSDAKKKEVDLGISADEVLQQLVQHKPYFEEVTQPVLVHWDMWEGNIFIKDKHVSGIIDWERAVWGEAFMDDRFRRASRNQDFLRGYGQEEFSEAEQKRIYWYDVLLYLTMMTEGAYREYEDDGQYQWAKPMFEASWKELVS